MSKPLQLGSSVTVKAATDKLFSAPVHKEDKEFLINESIRTGLSQKELIRRALKALKAGPMIPNALPIKL